MFERNLFKTQNLLKAATKPKPNLLITRLFSYDRWYKVEEARDKRAQKKAEEHLKNKTYFELAKFLVNEGKEQFKKFYQESKEWHLDDPRIALKHGDLDYLFRFNNTQDLNKWIVSTDSSYEIGKSKAQFQLTEQNTGLFKGFISNEYDKPEKMKAIYTGYANITSVNQYKSFGRSKRFNLQGFSHFLLKVRGDGRAYALILATPEYYTITNTYMYMYPLYTHGGPYWQYVRIPFSKFFNVTHGRVSDRQGRFPATEVKRFGITCIDGAQGPFSLELDHMAVYRDEEAHEEFAYESYKIPKYVSNT